MVMTETMACRTPGDSSCFRGCSSPTTCFIGRGVAFGLQVLLLRVRAPLEQQGREAKRRGLDGQGEPASHLRADRSS